MGKSTSVLFNLRIFVFGLPLSNPRCRYLEAGGRLRGSYDRMDICWPKDKLSFVAWLIL